MNYEREGLLLKETHSPQIDLELHESLSSVSRGLEKTYSELTLPNDAKEAVVSGWHEGIDADLSAKHVDEDALMLQRGALAQWKRELLERSDLNPTVKQLYRWKVNENIANVNMLIASQNGDMNNFRRWNEFIYGKPDEAIYRAALDWVAHDAEELLKVDQQAPTIIEAAQTVVNLLEDKRGYRELLAPEPETFEAVRADHMAKKGYYGLLLAGVEVPTGKITPEVGDPILEQVIKNIGSHKAIVDAQGASWSVTSRGVERPAHYNMVSKRFVGLGLGHEIGSHELERTNGERGPLALARDGLDRYELGNEGRAVIREQVPYETFDEFGKILRWRDILRRHIAISYASGVGEAHPHTASETYAFLKAIDTMYQVKLKPEDVESAQGLAQKKTDELLLRVLKGTDGTGGAYLKDKVYLEGHVANWLTAAQKGPQAISEGDLGKFDINNLRHIAALQYFGLLPDEE